jgi:hypothetical protein
MRSYERTYHIGFLAPKGKAGDLLIIQASEVLDCLSPDLWIYYGPRVTTKKYLYENRHALREAVNTDFGTSFTRVQVW